MVSTRWDYQLSQFYYQLSDEWISIKDAMLLKMIIFFNEPLINLQHLAMHISRQTKLSILNSLAAMTFAERFRISSY